MKTKIIYLLIIFFIYSCNKDDIKKDDEKETKDIDIKVSLAKPSNNIISMEKDTIIIAFDKKISLKNNKEIQNEDINSFVKLEISSKSNDRLKMTTRINKTKDSIFIYLKDNFNVKASYVLSILMGEKIEGISGNKKETFSFTTKFYKKIKTIKKSSVKDKAVLLGNFPNYSHLSGLFNTNSNFDADVYFVYYDTPNHDGKNVVASGIVAVPKSTDAMPILSYHHGTRVKNENVPSSLSTNNAIEDLGLGTNFHAIVQLLLESVSTFGFIMSMPDYIGFGSSKDEFHPYVIKKTSKTTSLNLIKAAKELVKAENKKLNGKLFLTGFSQGGYVTLATQIGFKENPIDGLQITASAPTAGVYSLTDVVNAYNAGDKYDYPIFFLYPLYVYNKVYNDIVINKYIKSPYDTKISLFDQKKDYSEINNEFPKDLSKLITADFLADKKKFPMYNRLKENNLNELKSVDYDCRFYHSTGDDVAKKEQSKNIANKITNSTYMFSDSGTHSESFVPLTSSVLKWFITLK